MSGPCQTHPCRKKDKQVIWHMSVHTNGGTCLWKSSELRESRATVTERWWGWLRNYSHTWGQWGKGSMTRSLPALLKMFFFNGDQFLHTGSTLLSQSSDLSELILDEHSLVSCAWAWTAQAAYSDLCTFMYTFICLTCYCSNRNWNKNWHRNWIRNWNKNWHRNWTRNWNKNWHGNLTLEKKILLLGFEPVTWSPVWCSTVKQHPHPQSSLSRSKHIKCSTNAIYWTKTHSSKQRTGKQHSSTKKVSYFVSHLIFHHFSLFNCWVSFCSFTKGMTPKICRLCFCPNK